MDMGSILEIKINKRFFINLVLVAITLLALLETVELVLIAYGIKTGLLCK